MSHNPSSTENTTVNYMSNNQINRKGATQDQDSKPGLSEEVTNADPRTNEAGQSEEQWAMVMSQDHRTQSIEELQAAEATGSKSF